MYCISNRAFGVNATRYTMKKTLFLATILVAASTTFLSGSKEDSNKEEQNEEVTLLGTWVSYNIDELGEFGELVARKATNDYSVTFTETNATLVIEDMPDGLSSITSTYDFKESDESIIYFTSAYSDYELKIVAQFTDGQLILQEACDYWDYSFMYYFTKE